MAVSANIVPIAYGTETDSSIIGPASANGIVGIKPTVGLTSRAGVIPESESMDTVGPMGRSVADAVHGLDAIVSRDVNDTATMQPDRRQEPSYISHISTRAALVGARFGMPQVRFWEVVPEDQRSVLMPILDAIRDAGSIIDDTDFPCAEERLNENGTWDWEHGTPETAEYTVVKAEAYNGIKSYLSELSDTEIRSVEDIVGYNIKNTGTEGAQPGDHPAFASGQVSVENFALHTSPD